MKWREKFIEIICISLILLFVYASSMKLIDFNQFVLQLSKSPMLIEIRYYVAWFIPAIELITAVLLVFRSTRAAGLLLSIALMSLFTFYIIAILGFSEYIPCSCGGILEKMGWGGHLVFNVIFLTLACLAAWLDSGRPSLRYSSAIILTAAVSVGGLFKITYQDSDKYSTFQISPLDAGPDLADSVDLAYNSFYFAGDDSDNLYFGNQTAPLILCIYEKSSGSVRTREISTEVPITTNTKLSIAGRSFFLTDGHEPLVLSGTLEDLVATAVKEEYGYFNEFVPINDQQFAYRMMDTVGNYCLALTRADSGFVLRPGVLKKQVDGKFDVDGMMHYTDIGHQFVYVYYYRNQFITLDSNLNNRIYRRTIDTIKRAKIRVSEISTGRQKKSSVYPELTVNKQSCITSEFLFIQAGIRAKNELPEKFSSSSRIDIYELLNGRYIGSFYAPLTSGGLRELSAADNRLFVLSDRYLFRYDISRVLAEARAVAQKNITGR